jgi:hypothetical protein
VGIGRCTLGRPHAHTVHTCEPAVSGAGTGVRARWVIQPKVICKHVQQRLHAYRPVHTQTHRHRHTHAPTCTHTHPGIAQRSPSRLVVGRQRQRGGCGSVRAQVDGPGVLGGTGGKGRENVALGRRSRATPDVPIKRDMHGEIS